MLVLKGCGPKGYPGMPEVGNMPLPRKLLEHGVRDMVRISDARMSGTAFGTVVLHVAPEAEAGGPLALVRDGDEICFRRAGAPAGAAGHGRGAGRCAAAAWQTQSSATEIFPRLLPVCMCSMCMQADRGCDLDFLTGASGSTVERESH